MLTPSLLCFVAAVAANPVFQRIPIQLTQTCPSQCPTQTVLTQTCRPQTCPTQTVLPQTCPSQTCQTCLPQTCPACSTAFSTQGSTNQILSTPCQTCQNNQRNLFSPSPLVVRHPTNNCPCNQPVQNPMTNQPVNQEALNQVMLTKLLGPQFQMLLNPNAKVCNQCVAQKPKADVVPNIINNYIIIPPEYFKTNETKVEKIEDIFNRRTGNKGRRRKQNKQMAQRDEDFKLGDTSKSSDLVQNVAEINCSVSKSYDNNDNNLITQYSNHEIHGGQGQEENEFSCVENTNTNKLTNHHNEILSNDQYRPYPNGKQVSNAPLLKFLNEDDKSQLLLDKIGKFLGNVVSSSNINKNQEVLSEKNTNLEVKPVVASEQRHQYPERVRNVEEAIIKDFCLKNPAVPKEIAWSLLMNIKRQVQSQESLHHYPISYLPYGYGHYYSQKFNPNSQVSDRPQNRRQSEKRQKQPKPRRSERRNKNREIMHGSKEPCDTCEQGVQLNPTVIDVETEIITTEKISTTTENKVQEVPLKKVSETQMETPNDLIVKLEQIKDKFIKLNEIETTTMNYNKRVETFPELGKEDKVPTVYDNGVDYYPDFRGDNIAFYSSNEELERYHYTTDKIGVAEGKKHEQRYVKPKKHYFNDLISKINDNSKIDDPGSEYSLPIPIEESNENSDESVTNESEEIQFRTPPSLELPDFETKQINKYYASKEIDEKFVADDVEKSSAYSDAKSESKTQENDLQPVKVFSKDKKGRTSVETVFGHSKVMKYGQDADEARSSPIITYYLPEEAMTKDRIQLPEGDSAVVVAKSIHNLKEILE